MTAPAPFDAFEAKMRAAELPAIAVDTFRHYYEQFVGGHTGVVSERDLEPIESLPDAATLSGTEAAGIAALAQTVVVKLNGGLGTSMGMTEAKSLLPVKDGATFLDIIAEQILHLRRRRSCRLPLVLMNSFRTREDSLARLARYPEIAADLPPDFLQHRVPKIRADDRTPVEWPRDPAHEWCPPGHGDIYTALVSSGMLATLLERGYRYAFVSNSDNLGAVLDVTILGWLASRGLPFLMEVADRTEADRKGGHLARRRGGGLVLREIAQCPPDEIDRFQDVHRWRYFNTNTLWVDLESLASVLDARGGVLGLPMIVNEKTVDPADERSPAAVQLETAMGAAISVFDGAEAIRVPRERFLPVKTTSDLLVLWSDVYEMTEDRRVVPARPEAARDLVVDLDPAFFRRVDQLRERFPRGAPSLVDCRRLTVRGDVRFGAGVVVRGEVTVSQEGDEPRLVPDGEVLD